MSTFGLLAASIVALAIGPGLHRVARSRPGMLAGLDAFVVVAIGGLVLLSIVPEALHEVGWPAAVAMLLGLLGPTVAERGMERSAHRAHTAALVVALAGVTLHAVFDGVALHPGCGEQAAAAYGCQGSWHGTTLATAVVLHRLPVGLTVWILLRPIYGRKVAGGVLGLLAVSTIAGFVLGDWIATLGSSTPITVFQAFVGGSLLHVVIHRSHVRPSRAGARRRWNFQAGLGALVGALLVFILPHDAVHGVAAPHADGVHPSLGATFFALAVESAPALLLGYAAAGLVAVFLPRATIGWMARGGGLSRSLRGVAFGLPLPVCSCGVVPLYRSLVARGVPATAAMAFIVATPELGLDAVLLSFPLLGLPLTAVRVVAAGVVAVLVGWLVGRVAERRATPVEIDAAAPPPWGEGWVARLRAAARVGFGEVFESTAPWILLGLLVAAVAHPLLEGGWIRTVPAVLQVPLFAALGMPTYVCASGATPLAAVLIFEGVSPGAALAFLLTGPATNVTTFGLLRELHGRRVALLFGVAMAGLAVAAGYVTDLLLAGGDGFAPDGTNEHGVPLPNAVALGALGLVLLVTLLRVGPRHLLESIFPPHAAAAAADDDDDDDDDKADDGPEGAGESVGDALGGADAGCGACCESGCAGAASLGGPRQGRGPVSR